MIPGQSGNLLMERFYSKVNPIDHNRNLLKDSIIVEEKAEAYQLKMMKKLMVMTNLFDYKHVWKLEPAFWSGASTR